MIGERLGELTVLAKIGRGGMGAVYLATDGGGQRVALKVLDEAAEGDGTLRRFAQELELLRRVDHPRIVRALGGLQRHAGRSFFAMEYVRGRNLAQLLAEVGRLEPTEALRIAAEALEGLAAAHAVGVLHRDVKSANLLLDAAGGVKVCDFGLARAVDQTRVTLSGQLLGTPAYASPEQARGHESRVESDLYSLGVVLYEALTGSLPFRAETPLALLRLHLDEAPDAPSARRPGLPAAIDALVLRALAKRPQERFPSAEAMRAEVQAAAAAIGPAPGAAPEPSSLEVLRQRVLTESTALERSALEAQRSPRRLKLAAAIAVLALIPLGWRFAPWTAGAPALGVAPVATRDGPAPEGAPVPTSAEVARVDAPPPRTATLRLRDGRDVRGTLVGIRDGAATVRLEDGREERHALSDVTTIRYDR